MPSLAEFITAPEPFLSTYDGPILTGLARGGLLDSLAWPSWWWTGLQGREELRMWASLSGSGDGQQGGSTGPGRPRQCPSCQLWSQSKRTCQHLLPHLPLCPSPTPSNTPGHSNPVCFQLRLKTRQGCDSESPVNLALRLFSACAQGPGTESPPRHGCCMLALGR